MECQEALLPPIDLSDLFTQQASYVSRALRRCGVHEHDVEDLAQDVFLTVHGKLGSYDPRRPVRPWLNGFIARIAWAYRRLARQRYGSSPKGDEQDPAPSAEELLASAQTRARIQQALEQLSSEKRQVFLLHEIQEEPVAAVATQLGIPLNTAYSRLRHARIDFETAVRRLVGRDSRHYRDQ
jgi:RNA polymerase sigma-70 factor, ECF subfamily